MHIRGVTRTVATRGFAGEAVRAPSTSNESEARRPGYVGAARTSPGDPGMASRRTRSGKPAMQPHQATSGSSRWLYGHERTCDL